MFRLKVLMNKNPFTRERDIDLNLKEVTLLISFYSVGVEEFSCLFLLGVFLKSVSFDIGLTKNALSLRGCENNILLLKLFKNP